jgi:hypothetical protein
MKCHLCYILTLSSVLLNLGKVKDDNLSKRTYFIESMPGEFCEGAGARLARDANDADAALAVPGRGCENRRRKSN